jgi:Skp family chaperone for outer membrane proteins
MLIFYLTVYFINFVAVKNPETLIQTYIFVGAAFLTGFIAAWIIRTFTLAAFRKNLKSNLGFLESEKLRKEVLQKENLQLHQWNNDTREKYNGRLKELQALNDRLDEDILLLQKSNEETEALLHLTQPEVHALKLKLIEANNSIARYKAQLGMKDQAD